MSTPREVPCIAVYGSFSYQGSMEGLVPGAYRLRIMHYSAFGWGVVVFQQDVEVG